MKTILLSIIVMFSFLASKQTNAKQPADFILQTTVSGKLIEGQPLRWNASQMMVLGRTGEVHIFNPRDAKHSKKFKRAFSGYSFNIVKDGLRKEFGSNFKLSTTRHYIVVHPVRLKDDWPQRFEKLYRSFTHYFKVRGFQIQEPKFPLVAILFPSKAAYYEYSKQHGVTLQPGTLGHYDQKTNRAFLFEEQKQYASGPKISDTIIHEATHQAAYNTGIHTRYAGTPRWLAEGLATMFEPKGVWNADSQDKQKARINRGRLRDFKQLCKEENAKGFLLPMLASDVNFRTHPQEAYAQAWAFSFYLSETRPRKYAAFLARTAKRKMFTSYSANARVKDFKAIFGENLPWLESQFFMYMESIE